VDPKEITQHIPLICRDKGVKCAEVDSKKKLGVSIGIGVSCSAVAVIEAGEADKDIASL